MDQSDFHKDFIESEEAFIDQFNPHSQNYHNGIPVPVPVGGCRVPESMPTMYPDTDLKEYLVPEQQEDFGPQYKQVMKEKEMLDQLKKNLNKITQSHEAVLRKQELLKKTELQQSQAQKFQKQYDDELKQLQINIEFIQEQIKWLNQQNKFKYQDLQQILILSQKQYKSKEELFEFQRLIKNITQAIFKDNQKLTEEIKVIKKLNCQKK